MTKRDRQKRDECWRSDCKYFEWHCELFHGRECKMLGGTKIPRMRDLTKTLDLAPRSQSVGMKPYFIQAADRT